MKETGMYRYR